MQKRTSKLFLLFFFIVNLIHAEDYWILGKVPLMDNLKSVYNINSYFASMDTITDYIIIKKDLVLFAVNRIGFVLYDFNNDETTNIPSPFDFKVVSVRMMFYDKKNNTVHMVVETVRQLCYYYVLGLDAYSWDKIEELSYPNSTISKFFYDSFDEKIYYEEILNRDITIFDFQTREVIERIKIFENEWHRVEIFYENPVRIFGQVHTGPSEDDMYYFVYDFHSKTKEIFHSTVAKRGISSINDYVYLDAYRFLCLDIIRLDLSEIIEIDLLNDTYRKVAFDDFKHFFYMLKRNHGNLMNFIVVEEVGVLFRKHRFLFCFWEYPE
jgi:hypothetical protein